MNYIIEKLAKYILEFILKDFTTFLWGYPAFMGDIFSAAKVMNSSFYNTFVKLVTSHTVFASSFFRLLKNIFYIW